MRSGVRDGVSAAKPRDYLIEPEDLVLVTGAGGFIGKRVVHALLRYGFKHVRCFVRATSSSRALEEMSREFADARIEIVRGNLLSQRDCKVASEGAHVVYHLAAGVDKTFPGCFLNSAVTTRNLLDAIVEEKTLRRFVNVSSLAVYSSKVNRPGQPLDESCEVDPRLVERYDPYAYGKAKQDQIVLDYGLARALPYVIVRPGVTFGPGKARIPGRVGTDSLGVFLHLGLTNRMPLTYVDNCAEAIVLAGLQPGIDGETINIVDDDLPKSSEFLRLYKKRVRHFFSLPVPYPAFYLFSCLWERYSKWSEGQLPPVFNRLSCAAYYKGRSFSNKKAKELLGWYPRVSMKDGLDRFVAYAREVQQSHD